MSNATWNIIVLLASLAVGALVFLWTKLKFSKKIGILQSNLDMLEKQINEKQEQFNQEKMAWEEKGQQLENDLFTARNSLTESEVNNNFLNQKLKEKQEEFKEYNEKFKAEFENLAQKILDEKSEKFTQQNKQQLDSILDPFAKAMGEFKKKVEDNTVQTAGKFGELKNELEHLKSLNERIGLEAQNLTKALKGDKKAQGNWGEQILEQLLESSGLVEGVNYFKQDYHRTKEGAKQLDFRVLLPNERNIIIDSKVSINDYQNFFNAEEDEEKELFLSQHLRAVKRHIDNLSKVNYPSIDLQTLEYTIMFIPIEPAYISAVQHDPGLFNYAYNKQIVLASPSTLWAMLKTIENLWQRENQNKNVIEIAQQASALYDKFVGLLDDYNKVQNQLQTVSGSFENMGKKLKGKGNLVNQVQKIKELGVSSKKQINNKWLENEVD